MISKINALNRIHVFKGAHKIVGLVEGRDFEAQLFVLAKPGYESLFEMGSYSDENVIEKPFVILLKEPNLEVDAYGTVNIL